MESTEPPFYNCQDGSSSENFAYHSHGGVRTGSVNHWLMPYQVEILSRTTTEGEAPRTSIGCLQNERNSALDGRQPQDAKML